LLLLAVASSVASSVAVAVAGSFFFSSSGLVSVMATEVPTASLVFVRLNVDLSLAKVDIVVDLSVESVGGLGTQDHNDQETDNKKKFVALRWSSQLMRASGH
jgi:hypothetical protein